MNARVKVISESLGTTVHKPVLVNEVLEHLDLRPAGVYLDVTFGSGGHTRAILTREPTCKVIAMDWDMEALERFGNPLVDEFGDRLRLVWGNFSLLYKILKKERIHEVDGILADFGTSQVQIVERAGFSVYRDTDLDMRMSPAHQQVTAAGVLATASEEKLRQLFWQLGEERYAKQIARAIVEERIKKRIETTMQLADLIAGVVPHNAGQRIHPATKVFQALRMYVNKELANIESLLAVSLRIVNVGGRIVCISFHSLEDRIVKRFFQDHETQGELSIVTPHAITASTTELMTNPSARSAKLRAAQKVGGGEENLMPIV
jgi:16S rRNA (cytosine1402-N4)-methyltransferase